MFLDFINHSIRSDSLHGESAHLTAFTYAEQPYTYKQSQRNSVFTIPVAAKREMTCTAKPDPDYSDPWVVRTILGQL
jgi:hypothetical protein